jgi:hypothetical protein
MVGSKHYDGKAFDFRTWGLSSKQQQEFCDRCAEALGDEFDVVLESDHLHVEWDPKEGETAVA